MKVNTKFMCTVNTRNYPVVTIMPNIQRYSSIRKGLTYGEIANCLAAYATVTLHKKNGSNVALSRTTFKTVLAKYAIELAQADIDSNYDSSVKKNEERLEELKSSTKETTAAPVKAAAKPVEVEDEQPDPEDPEVNDFSYIDGDDEELPEEE